MTSLVDLPVELITQIALETSRRTERDYFTAGSVNQLLHTDKTVLSMALVSKYLYSSVRNLRFRTICVRLCRLCASCRRCNRHSDRFNYIQGQLTPGAIKAIQIVGEVEAVTWLEARTLYTQFFACPALDSVRILGLVNVQHNMSLLQWLSRSSVETLLLTEIDEDGTTRTFTSAMCQFLSSFPSLHTTDLIFQNKRPMHNAYVLDLLKLKALRVFYSPVFTHLSPLLGLRMLEIEYAAVPDTLQVFERAHCKLPHLRILSIFTSFERPDGGDDSKVSTRITWVNYHSWSNAARCLKNCAAAS